MLTDGQKRDLRQEFGRLANMPPGKLERWLASAESRAVGRNGQRREADQRVGRRIVELKRTKMDDLLDVDYQHMQEVVDHLQRRLDRRPDDPGAREAWRRALMNWGHDPDAAGV